MAKVIEIPYTPRKYFEPLHSNNARYKVVVAHRRCGKTTACINHLIRDALTVAQSRYAYIAPTYKQAKNIAWDMLKYFSQPIPNIKINESELKIDYPNGSRIQLYGADNPDSLRGMGLWGVVFDEYSQQPSNIFTEIISPCLLDHNGYVIWIGTPKGKNEFFRLYEKGLKTDNWLSLLLKVSDTNIFTKEQLDNERVNMSKEEYEQEYNCSFEASIKGSIYLDEINQARQDKRFGLFPYNRDLRVWTVSDLGRGQNMATGFYQRKDGKIFMIDYEEGASNEGLSDAIKKILQKPYVYGGHYAPHDINHTEVMSGQTRIDTARALGINFLKIPMLGVEEGINRGKAVFSRLYVDENKCRLWLDAMPMYRREWDDKRGMFKEIPLHDWASHPADVHRYMALVESQFEQQVNIIYPEDTYQPTSPYEGQLR